MGFYYMIYITQLKAELSGHRGDGSRERHTGQGVHDYSNHREVMHPLPLS